VPAPISRSAVDAAGGDAVVVRLQRREAGLKACATFEIDDS